MALRSSRAAPAAALALALGACRIPELHVHNLREVRDPDGSASYRGAPMGEIEWLFRDLVLANFDPGGLDLPFRTKEDEPIADPDGIALASLLGLADCDPGDPHTLGLQVESYAWLGVDDEYTLARERAVLELGRAGERLGVDRPVQLGPDERPLGADAVAGLLGELIRAGRPFLVGAVPTAEVGEAAPPPPPAEAAERLAEVAERIRAATLDREGARRLLSAANVLVLAAGDGPAAAPLAALRDDLMRRSVALALGEAVRDPAGRVRAAAVQAVSRISGHGLPSVLLQALADPDPLVARRALALVRNRGLPEPGRPLEPAERAEYEALWLGRLAELAASPDGDLSAAACLALTRVAPEGPGTLRWEEWLAWHEERRASSRAAPRADETGAPVPQAPPP